LNEFVETLERFRSAVSGPADEVPLGRGALLVAQAQYPGLDIDGYERRLQQLAEVLAPRLDGASDAPARVKVANDLLFSELGFYGNDEQYDDVRNLFLNDVIERRTGIPITLAIVYIEVCQRAGLDVRGVGLPGHVVARIEEPEGESLYIDVFRGGLLLSAGDCRRLVRDTHGPRTEFRDHFLSAVTTRQLLQRLLHNLKARALQSGDEERAARAIDLLLAMYPWDLDDLRDRGMLRERLGDYPAALDDLERYVHYRAGAPDIETVSEAMRSLRRHVRPDRG
jgi:regulator of sirC expression with transglutaminase-like and TPR domain